MSYMDKTILYTLGHKCTPNGVGDYELFCSKIGTVPGFIPFMMRGTLKKCEGCGKEIEAITSHPSWLIRG